jgi:hypothetical protein
MTMGWAPQPPGSWPYFELVNQRIDELHAAAERDHMARLSRRSRSRRVRDRARRWLRQPAAVAARVNHVVGWIISPPARPSPRH